MTSPQWQEIAQSIIGLGLRTTEVDRVYVMCNKIVTRLAGRYRMLDRTSSRHPLHRLIDQDGRDNHRVASPLPIRQTRSVKISISSTTVRLIIRKLGLSPIRTRHHQKGKTNSARSSARVEPTNYHYARKHQQVKLTPAETTRHNPIAQMSVGGKFRS